MADFARMQAASGVMDMARSEKPGPPTVFCTLHGPMPPTPSGGCSGCVTQIRQQEVVGCPLHGLQPKTEGSDLCPICEATNTDPADFVQAAEKSEAEINAATDSWSEIQAATPGTVAIKPDK